MVWAGVPCPQLHVCRAWPCQLAGRDPGALLLVLSYGVCGHSEAGSCFLPKANADDGAVACLQCVEGW